MTKRLSSCWARRRRPPSPRWTSTSSTHWVAREGGGAYSPRSDLFRERQHPQRSSSFTTTRTASSYSPCYPPPLRDECRSQSVHEIMRQRFFQNITNSRSIEVQPTLTYTSTLLRRYLSTVAAVADDSEAAAVVAEDEEQEQQADIQKWSKHRLAETTSLEEMKPIVADIALRLGRQWDLLDDLHQLTFQLQQHEPNISNSNKKRDNSIIINNNNNGAANDTHDWWSSHKDDPQRRLQISQALETLSKTMHSMKVLHQDTQRQCELFHGNFPDEETADRLTPLFQRQLGQAFKEIYARHALTIETMAEIVIDLRGILVDQEENGGGGGGGGDDTTTTTTTMMQVKSIVTTFLKSRLLTQLLCDHIVDCTLYRQRKPNGAISVHSNVPDLVQSAITEARHLVEANFIPVAEEYDSSSSSVELVMDVDHEPPEPPQVIIETSSSSPSDAPLTATLVRPWLQYALVELLKNSLAVTMERNRRDNDQSPFWPLYARIYETDDYLVVQLLDQGGGFPETSEDDSHKKDWFEFAKRRDKWDRMDEQQSYAMVRSPVRGLGVGLALSRLHLRLFGGDLILEDRPADDGSNNLQRGLTATLLMAKDFETPETDIYS